MATETKYYPSNEPPQYSYDNPQVMQPMQGQGQPPMHPPGQPPMHAPGQPHMQPYQAPPTSTTNVIVVNQQPAAFQKVILGPVDGHRDWATDLFGCFNDTGGCLWTCCCTTCVLAEISTKLHENLCVTCCVPGGTITLRTRLRTLGGIQGSICDDCCTIGCCYFCAVCQMSRELTNMGL